MKNDIFKEIRTLLFEHDYVTIPNFGAFIAHYHSADFSSETSLFVPPKRNISFNTLLKQDDGLLASKVSRTFHIQMEEAKRKVEDFVVNLKSELSQHGQVKFPEIGIFTLSAENNIVFQPNHSQNYFSESFGFESFYSIDKIKFQTSIASVESQSAFFNENSMEHFDIPTFTPAKRTPIYIKALYALPIALLGAGLAFVLWVNPAREKVALSSVNPIDQITSFQNNVAKPFEVQRLVIGIFREEANAKKIYNHLVLNGFDPFVETSKDGTKVFLKVTEDTQNETSEKLQQFIGQRGVLESK